MVKIVRFAFTVLILLQVAAPSTGLAAPAPPFEAYLLRAETVFIGRIAERADREVSFETLELLRGGTNLAYSIRRYALDREGTVSAENQTWLVISQGDNHFGLPRQIISLGPQMDGQNSYRGWIAFPIRGDGDQAYLDHVFTFAGRRAGEPLTRLTLEKARMLIQQYLYNPDLYDAM